MKYVFDGDGKQYDFDFKAYDFQTWYGLLFDYDFKTANAYISFLSDKLDYDFKEWVLLDNFLFYGSNIYITAMEKYAWPNASIWEFKKYNSYKEIPKKVWDFFSYSDEE